MRIQSTALLLILAAATIQARPERFDTKKLEGTYTIMSGKSDGKPIPADEIKGWTVTFTKDRVTGHDKDRKVFYSATYSIDDTTKPYTIRMESLEPKKGEMSSGVIEIDGATVKLCYNLPGGKAPRKFDAGEKQHCFRLMKMK
jgi:uncharacterized protein (TIGR03067 family)